MVAHRHVLLRLRVDVLEYAHPLKQLKPCRVLLCVMGARSPTGCVLRVFKRRDFYSCSTTGRYSAVSGGMGEQKLLSANKRVPLWQSPEMIMLSRRVCLGDGETSVQ